MMIRRMRSQAGSEAKRAAKRRRAVLNMGGVALRSENNEQLNQTVELEEWLVNGSTEAVEGAIDAHGGIIFAHERIAVLNGEKLYGACGHKGLSVLHIEADVHLACRCQVSD